MSVIIINPNSSASMTDAMLSAARAAAPEIVFEGWTSHDGPPAIQGAADGEAASAPLLELVARADAANASGIVIGCFDDTALAEAAHAAACPVVGLGQASFHLCALRQLRFSVVTTLAVSVPVIEQNIRDYGLWHLLGRVRASDVPVLDLDAHPEAASDRILAESREAVERDNVDGIVLGCAGMVHVVERVQAALPVPVIDPTWAAATSMRWLLS